MSTRRTITVATTVLALCVAGKLEANALNILWDDTHDTDGDEISGASPNYSELAAIASALGHTITERDAGDLTDLSGVDLLMIFDAEVAFSANEIAAIQGFVAQGGLLLVLGEIPGAFDRDSHNTLLTPWDLSFTTLAAPVVDVLADADAGDDIPFSPLIFTSFGELSVTGAASLLGTTGTFLVDGFASGADGRVLVLTDSNVLDDVTISPGSNEEAFVVTLLDYFCSLAGDGGTLEITIDVLPGDDGNTVNPGRRGLLTVAILTTSVADGDSQDFDAWEVDSLSLTLGPGEAPIAHAQGHAQDVDGDGDLDMLVHFRVPEIGMDCETEELTLSGETLDGVPVEGADSVVAVGCP